MISKNTFALCTMLLSSGLPASVVYGHNDAFQAVLHKVEVLSDLFQPDDTLLVTCWFQNIGEKPSTKPLTGFAELSFGHQRIVETTPLFHRYYWDIYPSTCQWQQGDLWKTTFKCKMNLGWGGTYTIKIGLCDEEHLPVKIKGEGGKLQEQVEIGFVDLGWSWGTPLMDQVRKPFEVVINKISEISKTSKNLKSLEIGGSLKVGMNGREPEILKVGGVANSVSTRGMVPVISIRDTGNDQLLYSTGEGVITSYQPVSDGNKISYKGNVSYRGTNIAEFTLRFEVIQEDLVLSLLDVTEKPGYELLEINIPSLLSLEGSDAEILNFIAGGRLLSLREAIPEGYTIKYDTRNAAALLDGDNKIVLESACIDDKLVISVLDDGKIKTANLGMVLVNKVRGKKKMASIPVEHPHTVKICSLDKSWGDDGWQAVARYLRKDIQATPLDLYKRALIYKQLATSGPEPPAGYVTEQSPYSVTRLNHVITFKEIFDIVKKNYYVLDGMPQILYIGGFQENGFDSSYPYVLNTDQRVGTVEELRNYIQEAKQYNTILSMHDNYDSDVLCTSHYDPRIASIDEEGRPWMGWFWAGGVDHIVSPYKYAALGLMQERVKQTIQTYHPAGSYHIDVLTSELLRYDFDPKYPASAEKSLQGKYRIIDEFNKQGIDVTSETLLHPFIGHIGFGLHTRTDPGAVFFNKEKYVPLVDMVYHGTIPYAGGGRSEQAILMGLMQGSGIFISEDGITDDDVKWVYLHQMPVGLLYDKKIDKITEDNGATKVVYGADTYVKVNFDKKTYEVKVDGRIIAKDWSSFLPGFKANTYLAYSVKGGALDYALPEGWSSKSKLKAVVLTFDGDGKELPCRIVDGKIDIVLPASTPVRITLLNESPEKGI